MEMTVTFIGHSNCYEVSEAIVKREIEKLIKEGVCCFISGGQGGFDRLCARCVFELKQKYPYIKNDLFIPYLNFNIFDKKIFDTILYPEGFENLYFKAAIVAKNEYLIKNSDVALCYIRHQWGGAAKTYEKAIKKGITLINL